MGLMDSMKAFFHSVTTDDHYASYGSPYQNSSAGGSLNQSNSSSSRLHELNNQSTHSLMSSRNTSSSNIVGYRPGLRSSSTNVGNINAANGAHELQTFGADGQPPLPSIDALWDRIEKFLEEEYPELEDSLNSGASSADLNEFEKDMAIGPLPVEVRQFYKRHDGQFRGGKPTGILMGLTILDVESIMEEYTIWAKVAERVERQRSALQHQQQQLARAEGTSASQISQDRLSNSYLMHQKSIPEDAVQPYYVHRGWIPIARDLVGNMIALDMAPGPAGVRGQIILFGREFDTKVVVASNLQELLLHFVTDLETGNYQIDKTESNDDNGFLDSSRTDDYMIGDEDEDNGELSFFDRNGAEFGKSSKNKLSYIEVLKRRALARHGISRADNFQTTFTPQRIPKRTSQATQAKSGSKPGSSSHLVDVESTADLLKETLIDTKVKADDKSEAKSEAPSKVIPESTKKPQQEVAASKSEDSQVASAVAPAAAKVADASKKTPEENSKKTPEENSKKTPEENSKTEVEEAKEKSIDAKKSDVDENGHTEIAL